MQGDLPGEAMKVEHVVELRQEDVLAKLAGSINKSWRDGTVGAIQNLHHCGLELLEAKKQVGHGRWLIWVEQNLEFNGDTAARLMRLAKTSLTTDLNSYEATRLSRELWGNHDEVPVITPHRTQNTGEVEWYTPPEYVQAVKDVLGDVDLDPASSLVANETVQAKEFFDKDKDGLSREWKAEKVFMNPPYSQPLIAQFTDKLIGEFESGNIREAISLTNDSSDTEWFHRAASRCTALCLTKGRISFSNPDGEKGSPLQGQAFFYFGSEVARFAERFKSVGIVMTPYVL